MGCQKWLCLCAFQFFSLISDGLAGVHCYFFPNCRNVYDRDHLLSPLRLCWICIIGLQIMVRPGDLPGMAVRVVSFQTGDTKSEKFWPKNQVTQRKLSNFEFWIDGDQEVVKFGFQSQFSMSKIIRIFLIFWPRRRSRGPRNHFLGREHSFKICCISS